MERSEGLWPFVFLVTPQMIYLNSLGGGGSGMRWLGSKAIPYPGEDVSP